jgi:hypothetical protein
MLNCAKMGRHDNGGSVFACDNREKFSDFFEEMLSQFRSFNEMQSMIFAFWAPASSREHASSQRLQPRLFHWRTLDP